MNGTIALLEFKREVREKIQSILDKYNPEEAKEELVISEEDYNRIEVLQNYIEPKREKTTLAYINYYGAIPIAKEQKCIVKN
jgi:hypothetical protein